MTPDDGIRCPCGALRDPHDKFCRECGQALAEAPKAAGEFQDFALCECGCEYAKGTAACPRCGRPGDGTKAAVHRETGLGQGISSAHDRRGLEPAASSVPTTPAQPRTTSGSAAWSTEKWILVAGAIFAVIATGVVVANMDNKQPSPTPRAPSSLAPPVDPITSNQYYQDLEVAWPRFPYNQKVLWCGMYSQGTSAFAAWLGGYGSGTPVSDEDVEAVGAFLSQNCPP